MNKISMTSTKPYLLRAIFEWAEDNGFTPQVLVDADVSGVIVPRNHVIDGQIVLNIGSGAVKLHLMDNECLSFSARFGGVEQDVYLPISAVLAIFARENSKGIFFEDVDNGGDDPESKQTPVEKDNKGDKASTTNINSKRQAAHLKIIK
ncbi:MAG: ClpXP protease specificity-enhancing factor [Gammaproteobacteria bacterium]|nr:ClpXP protease specificity-enhancing factor [Gammaproteobacteria bacterium]